MSAEAKGTPVERLEDVAAEFAASVFTQVEEAEQKVREAVEKSEPALHVAFPSETTMEMALDILATLTGATETPTAGGPALAAVPDEVPA